MNPLDLPHLHGGPLGPARLKSEPADFVVEEVLGFEPSGEGEHCFLWVEKIGRNSNDVAGVLAERAGVRKRLVSHCGQKDLHATTRQWFSIHLPGQASPSPDQLEVEGVRILRIDRNTRKLRRGSHRGNRFAIRLRDCDFSPEAAAGRWREISERGVPNYFGSQRFGRGGGNVGQALRMFAGEIEVRDRLLRGMLLSSARSHLFNACVAGRVKRGDWDRVLDGEVFGFPDNRSLILPANLRGDEEERVANGLLEITAPLWGQGELPSRGSVREIEEEVSAAHRELAIGLERTGLRQERRTIRLRPLDPEMESDGSDAMLRFELPKGAYATAVIRELAAC